MTDTMECHLMCRLCLVKEQVNIPIFEEQGNLHTLQKITTCLPLKVTREDRLPKSICDGCNFKLDQQYQFWNTSVNAEKQLKSWLGIVDEPPPKVKKEKEVEEVTVSKRPRRNARRKAAANARKMAAIPSDSDDDNRDFDSGHTVAKEEAASDVEYNENDSLEPTTFVNVSLQDPEQAGPSGVQKSGSSSSAPATATSNTEAGTMIETIKEEAIEDYQTDQKPEIIMANMLYTEGFMQVNDGFQCKTCGQVCKSKKVWKRHYLRHVTDRPFSCEICGKCYKSTDQLKSHNRQVHQENRKVFACDICDLKASSMAVLKNHRYTHLNIYPFSCTKCDKKFRSKAGLINHTQGKHEGVSYYCDVCVKSFTTISGLNDHKKKQHDPNYVRPEFKCDVCPKSYPTKTLLRRHREGHEGFTCETCGLVLASRAGLKRHLLTHTGAKPLTCKYCGKHFASSTILGPHLRIHTGAKPYECTVCGKRFNQRSPMVLHMRNHTGERPYKCTHCTESFISRAVLNVHLQKYHLLVK